MKAPRNPWTVLTVLLFLVLSGLVGATFRHYGLTWDEDICRQNGDWAWSWYAALLTGKPRPELPMQPSSAFIVSGYGAFFNLLAQVAGRVLPLDFFEAQHLLIAVFGTCGVFAAYRLGGQLAGPMGGFFSALFLVLTPVYYGHSFNNPKDVPFAALFLLALDLMLRTHDAVPRVPAKALAGLAGIFGLAMGIRVGGVLLLFYLALFWAFAMAVCYRAQPAAIRGGLFASAGRLASRWLMVAAGAWCVMVLLWPYAQMAPVANPLKVMREVAHLNPELFGSKIFTVFFNGRWVGADALPWTYLPTWFAISLPEFYFLALATGVWAVVSGGWSWTASRTLRAGFLMLVAVFSVAVPILARSVVYDGLRHLLFVVPILAVLAGASIAGFLQSAAPPLARGLIAAAVVASCTLTVADMVVLHPYQALYFNRVVAGGLPRAAQKFETDYWGSSYKEGVDWLIRHYESPVPVRVANCSIDFLSAYPMSRTEELRRRFVPVRPSRSPDILLATTRWDCHKRSDKILHVVERQGTPLLYVFELGPPPPSSPGTSP